jgi:hypothetical protein
MQGGVLSEIVPSSEVIFVASSCDGNPLFTLTQT